MRHPASFRLFLGLIIISLVSGCVTAASRTDVPAAKGTMPEIKKDCQTCHTSHGSGGLLTLKAPIAQLCIGCHPDRKGPVEHKVDVVPPSPVAGLPLTEGKLTCVTCHDPHSNANGAMLRMIRAKLCLACHNY